MFMLESKLAHQKASCTYLFFGGNPIQKKEPLVLFTACRIRKQICVLYVEKVGEIYLARNKSVRYQDDKIDMRNIVL